MIYHYLVRAGCPHPAPQMVKGGGTVRWGGGSTLPQQKE